MQADLGCYAFDRGDINSLNLYIVECWVELTIIDYEKNYEVAFKQLWESTIMLKIDCADEIEKSSLQAVPRKHG